jgi:hypothetical protein
MDLFFSAIDTNSRISQNTKDGMPYSTACRKTSLEKRHEVKLLIDSAPIAKLLDVRSSRRSIQNLSVGTGYNLKTALYRDYFHC